MQSSIESFKGATSAPERIWTLLTAAYLNCNGKFSPPSSIRSRLVCDFLGSSVEVNPRTFARSQGGCCCSEKSVLAKGFTHTRSS